MKKISCILIPFLLLAACSKERQRQSENVPSEAAEVSVFKVSSRPIKSVYESEATIIAEGTVKIASKITAKVAESLLKEGKKVAKGELLLRLEAKELDANLEAAKFLRDKLQREFSREERLLKQGAAIPSTVKNLADELKSAKAKVREAEAFRQYLTIRSPIAGTVISKDVEAGDLALAGKTLCVVADTSRLQIEANLPVGAAKFLDGDAKIKVEAGGRSYWATLAEVSPTVDTQSNTQTCKFNIVAPFDGLKIGEIARAYIPTTTMRQIAIPLSCVSEFGQIDRVFAVSPDNRADMRIVKLGQKIGDGMVVVKAGLKDGDVLVENPPPQIREGSAIK